MNDMTLTAELVKDFANLPLKKEDIEEILKGVVVLAELNDLVVTVSQKSLLPPAMGHYETVIDVREKVYHGKS